MTNGFDFRTDSEKAGDAAIDETRTQKMEATKAMKVKMKCTEVKQKMPAAETATRPANNSKDSLNSKW